MNLNPDGQGAILLKYSTCAGANLPLFAAVPTPGCYPEEDVFQHFAHGVMDRE
jgi:hypothetical protein